MNSLQDLVIRPELKSDAAALEKVICQCYGNNLQSSLLSTLTKNAGLKRSLSLIALSGNEPKGHILLCPGYLRAGTDIHRTLILVMLSVLPEFRKRGIGSRLLAAGIDEARADKYGSIIAYGAADFFRKAGFVAAEDYNIRWPGSQDNSKLQVLEIESRSLDQVTGIVEFPEFLSAESLKKIITG